MSQFKLTSKFAIASLSLALAACGGSNHTAPTKPTIMPNGDSTAQQNLQKEAEEKRKAEEAKKAEEERLAKEAEEKRKAEEEKRKAEEAKKAEEERLAKEAEEKRKAEELRTQPQDFQAKAFVVTNAHQAFFAPVIEPKRDPWTNETINPLGETVALTGSGEGRSSQALNLQKSVNGQLTNINATYETYSYHLNDSAIAVIRGYGTYNGRPIEDFAYAYSGRATNVNELDTLKGTATYQGQGFFDGNVKVKANLLANFDSKKISGSLTNNQEKMSVALQETTIAKTSDNKIGFTGNVAYTVKGFGTFNGTYEGAFMGRGAKEVVGVVNIPNSSDSGSSIGGVFNAVKQD